MLKLWKCLLNTDRFVLSLLVPNEPLCLNLALQKGSFTVSWHAFTLRNSPTSVSMYNDYLDIIRIVKEEDVLH